MPADEAFGDAGWHRDLVALLGIRRYERPPFRFGQPHVVGLRFVRSSAAILIVGRQGRFPLIAMQEILAGHVAELSLIVAHEDPGISLEDQATSGRCDCSRLRINATRVGNLDGTGSPLCIGKGIPFSKYLWQVNSRMTCLIKHLAARRDTNLPGFELVQVQSRIAIELTNGILTLLVGTEDRKRDEVFSDQLDVFFRPVGGRTARIDTTTSAHADTETFARHHEEQRLAFSRSFLASFVEVGQPRNLHPA